MSYIQYIGAAMVFLIPVGALIWTVYRKGQLQEITQNKVLAIRITRVGNLWFELCPYENESAKVSKDGEVEAGAAALNNYNTARTEYPPQVTSTDRFLFDTQYPPTLHNVGKGSKTSFLTNLFRPTVSIRATVIPEGYSIGYMPWLSEDVDLYTKMTDRQLASMDDQAGEQMLRMTDKSLQSAHTGGSLKKSDKMWGLVLMLLILLLAGAAAGLAYMNYTELTSGGW